MSREIQPTSLILGVIVILIIAAKWAYDKGTNKAAGM